MRWSREIAIPVKLVISSTAWSAGKEEVFFLLFNTIFIRFWHWKALFSGKKFFLK
jgi:hypothetical protein